MNSGEEESKVGKSGDVKSKSGINSDVEEPKSEETMEFRGHVTSNEDSLSIDAAETKVASLSILDETSVTEIGDVKDNQDGLSIDAAVKVTQDHQTKEAIQMGSVLIALSKSNVPTNVSKHREGSRTEPISLIGATPPKPLSQIGRAHV